MAHFRLPGGVRLVVRLDDPIGVCLGVVGGVFIAVGAAAIVAVVRAAL